MAYNNGFPMNYSQYFMPYQQQPQQTQNGIIWVQGEAGAKSYLVAPNTTVQLWDSEKQVIYLKSADASGMPSLKTLDYTVRENAAPSVERHTAEYVTRNEFDDLKRQIESLKEANYEHDADVSTAKG